MCDQEGSWDCQSDFSSHHSTFEIWLQEEVAHDQSQNTQMQQQLTRSYNAYLVDYIENSNFGKSQSYSPSACLFSEIASNEESDLEFRVEERPLYAYQTQISLEDLQGHTKPSLFMEDEKDEQSCNQFQPMKKPAICHEGLNHKEEEEDSKWDFLYVFQIHKLFCLILLKNTMIFPLKHLEGIKF